MKRGAANERQFAGDTASPGALLFIRGPALPSVVSGFLTTDGKAGLRMKKMARGDTDASCGEDEAFRRTDVLIRPSVRGEDLGGRRTRRSVGPLRQARVECHPEEADRGGGGGQSQSASHTRRLGMTCAGMRHRESYRFRTTGPTIRRATGSRSCSSSDYPKKRRFQPSHPHCSHSFPHSRSLRFARK